MSHAPDPGEAALIVALREGDQTAYETVVRTYGGRLLAVARRILRNEEDARDALQDGFLQGFRAIGDFESGARLSTWLHRIVVNASLMKLRHKKRKAEPVIEDLLPRFLEDGHRADPGPAWKESTQELLERQETREFVRESIDHLPEDFRNVLLLRDIEGLDTQQTAEMLGISAGAVKTRLHRARQALRALLEPHMTQ